VLNDDDLCWSMLTLLGRGDLVFIQQHFVGEHAAHARQGAHALQRSDVALRAAASPINLHTCMYACACVCMCVCVCVRAHVYASFTASQRGCLWLLGWSTSTSVCVCVGIRCVCVGVIVFGSVYACVIVSECV